MIRKLIPTTLAAFAAAGLLITGPAGADPGPAEGSCPPPEESPPTTPADPDDLDDRCDISPESYVLGYAGGVMESSTGAVAPTAVPPATTTAGAPSPAEREDGAVADVDTASEGGAVVEPQPPLEPGVLDDNTFVDEGDSTWVETESDRESTFALDVDTGSFSVAQRFVEEGYLPEPDSIRAEEWINSFDYGDEPAAEGQLGITVDATTEGPEDGTALVRLGVSTADLDPMDRPAANITFVIDTSGSMDIRERLGMVQASLALLVRNLHPDDTISIVTYGDDARPVLAPTPLEDWREIVAAIDSLQSSGSTNMEAGLLLGYEQAREAYDADDINVVVLASDGVANNGVTDPEVLTEQITQSGEEGIHLVTVGYGMGNYNDYLMEQLADQGDGFYSYIDRFAEAERLFVEDLTPTLYVVAEQAKVQVVFDADVVEAYRLIGYENRGLDDEEFNDDTVDAGELGAGHHVSALYEVELVDGTDGPQLGDDSAAAVAGEVRLRWESPETGEVTEIDQPIEIGGADGVEASTSVRLAALVGYTAELLRGNEVVEDRGLTMVELLDEAEALAEAGVDGADDMVAFIAATIETNLPGPDPTYGD